ncbi:MAG: DNA-binding response regulator [Gammaproteobacteria bacterium]|nr:MAG: DNA-binding response regulator [Gammaproteobacteria bacterium]
MVHIVDDDEAVRESLALLLDSVGIRSRTYPNARAFLESDFRNTHGCVVLDIRMPGMSGMELHERLIEMGVEMPVIFITGHGDVPMAVEAMKRGAAEFIQKPFREQALLDCINRALETDARRRAERAEIDAIRARIASLTPRERQVMELIVQGKANKVIAFDLGLSQRTVEIHRAHVMEKMQTRSLAELVRQVMLAGDLGETPAD